MSLFTSAGGWAAVAGDVSAALPVVSPEFDGLEAAAAGRGPEEVEAAAGLDEEAPEAIGREENRINIRKKCNHSFTSLTTARSPWSRVHVLS